MIKTVALGLFVYAPAFLCWWGLLILLYQKIRTYVLEKRALKRARELK